MRLPFLAFWLVLLALPTQAQRLNLYVAPDGDDAAPGTEAQPFATWERARDAVRERKQGGSLHDAVTIYLRGGRYAITEPLVLTPEDSGTEGAPVTYAAYPGERPVLSGGRRLTGWQQGDDGAWFVDLPEVARGDWSFRQLYVDGHIRCRARIPNEGFLRVAAFPCGGRDVHYHTDCDRFGFAPGDLDPSWTNLDDVEVIVYHFWTDSHLPIQTIDTTAHVVTFKHEAGKVFTDDFTDGGARYIVENVYEGLDAPGEWYLNEQTGRLYYRPMPGENLASADIVAPLAPAFIRAEGQPLQRRLVEHVAFRDLTFEHTNFELPPGNSNDRQGSASVPAAITLRGAWHNEIAGCTVRHTGTSAIELGEGSRHNRFAYNELHSLAAGGFRVGGGDDEAHPLLRTGYNEITDNHLHHFGAVYPSAVGVLLMHTNGNTVVHNHIHHGYYTGISVGWEWGYQRSVSRDNVVAYNHIHDIGQGLLSDMGAIYTLGLSPGTVIRGNLIHDVDAHHYGGWGIYNDEGSSHILVEDNVVYRTKFAPYNIHFSKEVTVRNNVFALGRLVQLSRSRVEPHKSVFFENNIVYWTSGELLGGDWTDAPYSFHRRPFGEDGTPTMQETFEMDWNLYFNPNLPIDSVRFGEASFAEWQARGKDVHSRYADPQFIDPEGGNFRLEPDSPAFQLGFQPIDLGHVGPRPRGE